MAVEIKRKGYQGWLEHNYHELSGLQKQYPNHIKIEPSRDLKSFKLNAKGMGNYSHYSLSIFIYHPLPAQPPKIEILNREMLEKINHPNLRSIYVCLKSPWTPATPLSSPVRALVNAWWRPGRF